MPYLRLIDTQTDMPTEGAFAVGPEIVGHTVMDRNGARRILAYDLQNTADPKWSAEILAEFDAGQNVIEKPNGIDHTFRVEYLESVNA